MKRHVFMTVLSLILISFAAHGSARAAIRANSFTLTPSAGWLQTEGNQGIESGVTEGLALGVNFTREWSGELTGTFTNTETSVGALRTLIYTARVDALRHFFVDTSFVPYLAIGGGYYGVEVVENLNGNLFADYGLGCKWFLSDRLALRIDVRQLLVLTTNDRQDTRSYYNNLMATGGIAWQFYGSESLEKLSNDTDTDGIVDAYDRCPETKSGAKVDAAGCAQDPQLEEHLRLAREVTSDGDLDGVPNNVDRCPNTPPRLAVNSLGCPADSDGDGIFDFDDKCSDTPQGSIVNSAGCTIMAFGAPAMINGSKLGGLALNLEFLPQQDGILPSFEQDLAKAANFIKSHPNEYFLIDGHTDSVGSEELNVELSLKRAESVRSYLVTMYGIPAETLIARGFGEKQPIADNATQEGRMQNRRVVILPAARH